MITAPTNLIAASLAGRVDQKNGPLVECFVGIVDAVVYLPGGAPPPYAKASLWAYDVWVNFADGQRKVLAIKPVMERWDEAYNVVPIRVNTVVLVGSVNGNLQLMARELPHSVGCSE